MKTEAQIEEMFEEGCYGTAEYVQARYTEKYCYINGYSQAQKDLLDSASEGFEEWFSVSGLELFQTANKSNFKGIWQAAKLSAFKEVSRLVEINKQLTEKLVEVERVLKIENHYKFTNCDCPVGMNCDCEWGAR